MNIKTLLSRMAMGTLALWYVGALTSCSSNEDQNMTGSEQDANFAIIPSSGLGSIGTLTRAAINSSEDSDLAVSMFRIDHDEDDAIDIADLSAPADATLKGNTTGTAVEGKKNGCITFDTPQYYLSDGRYSSVISLYPRIGASDWNAEKLAAGYTLDGSMDLMATAWGKGRKNVNLKPVASEQPALHFEHLLTQVKIRVFAEDASAITAWGNITAIKLDKQPVSAVVTLSDKVVSETAGDNKVSLAMTSKEDGGTIGSLGFWITGEDGTDAAAAVESAEIPLRLTKEELEQDADAEQQYASLGYCIFAPATVAENEALEMTITTSTGGDTKVYVTKQQTYTAGTAYLITLVLKAYEIAPETVTIEDWEDETFDGEINI